MLGLQKRRTYATTGNIIPFSNDHKESKVVEGKMFGRLAMLGIIAGIGAYLTTGQLIPVCPMNYWKTAEQMNGRLAMMGLFAAVVNYGFTGWIIQALMSDIIPPPNTFRMVKHYYGACIPSVSCGNGLFLRAADDDDDDDEGGGVMSPVGVYQEHDRLSNHFRMCMKLHCNQRTTVRIFLNYNAEEHKRK